MSTSREAFRFHGTGSEYFRIWIVNVTLTLLTLGIYSAWAKVRRNRYIYGNLELAGSRFDYTARPLVILRGRLIAMALLGLYLGGQVLFPPLTLIIMLLLLVGTPWVIIRSRMFNLRYTTYRNIGFGFRPAYGESYKVLYLYGLMSVLTLGLAVPYAHYRRNRMLVSNARFGNHDFQLRGSSRSFYAAYMWSSVLLVLALIPFGMVMGGLEARFPTSEDADLPSIAVFAIVPLLFMAIIYLGIGQFLTAYVLRATVNNTAISADGDVPARLGSDWPLSGAVAIAVTNAIAILLSVGLLVPWAQMRMMRYQLNQTWLDVPHGLDNVLAAEESRVSSLGEEIGDVFDLDIGL